MDKTKQIYYKRIDINGDPERLPKNIDALYFVCRKNAKIGTLEFISSLRPGGMFMSNYKKWLKNIDWYLIPCTDKRDELIEKALKGLNEAKKLIRSWHGMGMQAIPEAEMWKIYNSKSPEMKRMNELIAELENNLNQER